MKHLPIILLSTLLGFSASAEEGKVAPPSNIPCQTNFVAGIDKSMQGVVNSVAEQITTYFDNFYQDEFIANRDNWRKFVHNLITGLVHQEIKDNGVLRPYEFAQKYGPLVKLTVEEFSESWIIPHNVLPDAEHFFGDQDLPNNTVQEILQQSVSATSLLAARSKIYVTTPLLDSIKFALQRDAGHTLQLASDRPADIATFLKNTKQLLEKLIENDTAAQFPDSDNLKLEARANNNQNKEPLSVREVKQIFRNFLKVRDEIKNSFDPVVDLLAQSPAKAEDQALIQEVCRQLAVWIKTHDTRSLPVKEEKLQPVPPQEVVPVQDTTVPVPEASLPGITIEVQKVDHPEFINSDEYILAPKDPQQKAAWQKKAQEPAPSIELTIQPSSVNLNQTENHAFSDILNLRRDDDFIFNDAYPSRQGKLGPHQPPRLEAVIDASTLRKLSPQLTIRIRKSRAWEQLPEYKDIFIDTLQEVERKNPGIFYEFCTLVDKIYFLDDTGALSYNPHKIKANLNPALFAAVEKGLIRYKGLGKKEKKTVKADGFYSSVGFELPDILKQDIAFPSHVVKFKNTLNDILQNAGSIPYSEHLDAAVLQSLFNSVFRIDYDVNNRTIYVKTNQHIGSHRDDPDKIHIYLARLLFLNAIDQIVSFKTIILRNHTFIDSSLTPEQQRIFKKKVKHDESSLMKPT
ncbi:MAG: hypothetical protein J6Y94_04890, partial [Bacteriovoracaceae bacterium]|nr:hypothetical protein [Bacteriovoracaceae bacterium]